MKQITKDTVLKQVIPSTKDCYGYIKSYPAIETEQGIVWIDKDAEKRNGDYVYHPQVSKEYIIVDDKKEGDDIYSKGEHISQGIYKHKPTTNPWYLKEVKIIAANFELEEVPKILLEDEIEKLARTNPKIQKHSKASYIPGFKDGYKANQSKYTEEDMRNAIEMSRETEEINCLCLIKKYKIKDIIQSFNYIKEITVDDQFQILNY